MDLIKQRFEETSFEAECRKQANFHEVEGKLPRRWDVSLMPAVDMVTSPLSSLNPFAKEADPSENKVWLLDNTAYRPEHPYPQSPQPWQAEFVACFFKTGRKDISECVSSILDRLGLDGSAGVNDEVRKRIETRITPFVDAIAPARTITVEIPSQDGRPLVRKLGPSNGDGISSQTELTGGSSAVDGTTVEVKSHNDAFPSLEASMRYAGTEGWSVISDIDDTIKITRTSDPLGILQTTFAEDPQTTEGMPEFYKVLDAEFQNPTWFFLSASPYNLYPFLRKFLHENYPHGTMILRENSWMFFSGLLQSLTQGVKTYKVSRMVKIHDWLPNRQMICVGDSTQSDPEAYAEIYSRFPGWIRAIYIRKVVDIPFMEEKNKPERFTKAFEKVPSSVWKLFERPEELADHVRTLANSAGLDISSQLENFGRS